MDKKCKAYKRYEYIDFLKGVAAIGIIGIHTAFWGGESYIPIWFKNMTLFLDVPFFFYLSGWGNSFRKSDIIRTVKGLGAIWCKWIYFVSVLALFCWFSRWFPYSFTGVENVRDLINNYMFNVSFPGFQVVGGSIWFMPYYFVIILINTFVICIIQSDENKEYICKMYMFFLAIAFIWVCYGKYALGIDWHYFLFFSFFWMMGKNRIGAIKTKRGFWICVMFVIFCIGFASYLQGLLFYDIQTAKFPPTIKYAFVSLLSILVAKHVEPYVTHTNKWINHVGRSAIFYYFSQGVGSSINFYIIPIIPTDNWFLKFLITFIINVIITTVIAEFLRVTYEYVAIWVRNIFSYFRGIWLDISE